MQNNLEPNGILLIDKPADYSSHDVINVCRKALNTRRIGHSGTLDPMATGLLIILVGKQATRRQDFFQQSPKTYSATLKLGIATDTWDAQGTETARAEVPPVHSEQLQCAVNKLTGEIRQPIPPFSAKKVQGARMYELARRGRELPERLASVTIYGWDNLAVLSADTLSFTVTCACGTYVRALGCLLARELGTVGHLTRLRRDKTGGMDVKNAHALADIKTMTPEEIRKRMLPADWGFTPQEEAARKQRAQEDRQKTAARLQEETLRRRERETARAARKAAARELYETRHAENVRKFQEEKAAFLAKKEAEKNRREPRI